MPDSGGGWGKTVILDTNSILSFSKAAQTDKFGKNDRF
jgi:hypothetical protein